MKLQGNFKKQTGLNTVIWTSFNMYSTMDQNPATKIFRGW